MAKKRDLDKAVEHIERHGMLLVYPIDNRAEPKSLWSCLHPRSEMRWAWDETADPRVVDLWHLREALARSKRVVYGKWYRRRATFFSQAAFRGLLASLHEVSALDREHLSQEARIILELLEEDSPQTTRRVRNEAGLSGKLLESTFLRSLDELWQRALIVGLREEADGGFPSLAVGPTRNVFEDLWATALERNAGDIEALTAALDAQTPLRRYYNQSLAKLSARR
ncbi:MAG: AlkZ-related protein [Polyangiales bacterium]